MKCMTERIHIPESVKREVAWSQEWKCNVCKQMLPYSFELDHIRPLHWGGLNHRTNYQVLCGTCHNNKSFKERQRDRHWEVCPEDRPAQAFCMRCETCFSPHFKHVCTNIPEFDRSGCHARVYDYCVSQICRKFKL